jgi:hypothetical protein
MSAGPSESTFIAIYNRIAPQIKIEGLNVRVNFAANDFDLGFVTGIEITSDNRYQHAELSLESDDEYDEDITNYIWTYSDLHSGWGTDSDLSYNAPDEEVVEWFTNTHLKNMEAFTKR